MLKMLLRLRQERVGDVKDADKTETRAELGTLKMLIRLRQEQSWGS